MTNVEMWDLLNLYLICPSFFPPLGGAHILLSAHEWRMGQIYV
jgi:hypothetical protein